jgi:hypothetical protein
VSASDKDGKRGEFVWPDMTSLNEDLWASGYPKEYKEEEDQETGVIFNTNIFKLQDQKWYNKNQFFCELPSELIDCL